MGLKTHTDGGEARGSSEARGGQKKVVTEKSMTLGHHS